MSDLRDRPILFSAPMIRRLVAGGKTQTRRTAEAVPSPPSETNIVHWPPKHPAPYLDSYCGGKWSARNPRRMSEMWCWWTRDDRSCEQFRCPYGAPGDLLWVRESHRLVDCDCSETCRVPGHVWYEATSDGYRACNLNRLRPSIHMPRWASRITLAITNVRLQRLHDLTEADAVAEGIMPRSGGLWHWDVYAREQCGFHTARGAYDALWTEINGRKSWPSNPWVWAVSFSVHLINIDSFPTLAEPGLEAIR